MSNRFVLPLETPVDATGAPYPGGKLFFYQSGTSTKLDTYSNSTLTIANTNPVILDSAGRFSNAIFLQNRPYTVVLAPADDSDPPTAPIWSQDNVYTSDYSTVAQFQSVNGSPNGQLAGNAGSATIPASVAWDYANNILYVCTTTGTASTAVWTAVNASTAAAVITAPQGYLTPTSGTAIITGDVTGATAIYYTPYRGLLVPIYNGTTFIPTSIVTELSLTLVSSHAANNIYDLYVFSTNGVATLGSGPSWSAGTGGSITSGSCARGTGTGGAALAMLSGFWTNAVQMTLRYGNGNQTAVVSPNMATYVGSMFIDGTNGQISCYRSFGQSRKWAVWNAYSQVGITLKVGDGTASWTYGTGTFRPSNNNTANKGTVFCGLAQSQVLVTAAQNIGSSAGSGVSSGGTIAVGWNSTSTPSGKSGRAIITNGGSATTTIGNNGSGTGFYISPPVLGIVDVTSLESGGGGTSTFYGTEVDMLLSLEWTG